MDDFQNKIERTQKNIDHLLDNWASTAGLDREVNAMFLGLNHLLLELSQKQVEFDNDDTATDGICPKEIDLMFFRLMHLFKCRPYLCRLALIYESQTQVEEYRTDPEFRETIDGLVASIRHSIAENMSYYDQIEAVIRGKMVELSNA